MMLKEVWATMQYSWQMDRNHILFTDILWEKIRSARAKARSPARSVVFHLTWRTWCSATTGFVIVFGYTKHKRLLAVKFKVYNNIHQKMSLPARPYHSELIMWHRQFIWTIYGQQPTTFLNLCGLQINRWSIINF